MSNPTTATLSRASTSLHWLAGSMMLYMLFSGLLMESLEVEWFFDSHTSLGVAIIAILIPRIVWRFIEGWPETIDPSTPGDMLILSPTRQELSESIHHLVG